MRTRKFRAEVVGWLLLVPCLSFVLAGCRSGCCHCSGDGGIPAGAAPVAASASMTSAAADPYQGQRTCPVSGAALAGVASPLPVTVRGQTVYVCCERCAAKLRSNPDAYLAKAAAERGGQPASTGADAGMYGGQKTCPVTGEELDAAGGAIPVNVRGQTIYVCCSGCAAKVQRNPDLYLARVMAERAKGNSSRP